MSVYRIFYVTTGRPKAGMIEEAGQWWNDQGRALFEAMPGTRSVRSYIAQFGLGRDTFTFEVWQELESYAALDHWDQQAQAELKAFSEFQSGFHHYYDLGPCRIMGEWPESEVRIV